MMKKRGGLDSTSKAQQYVMHFLLRVSLLGTAEIELLASSESVVQDIAVHLDHARAVLGRALQVGARGQEDVIDDALAGLAG